MKQISHEEKKRIVTGSKTAVLFIHGILGTPNQFQIFYPLLPENCTYISLLLSGHGKGVGDFSHASMTEWKKQVDDAVAMLTADHDAVYIAAHSMGTLFAIDAAVRYPDKVKRLFLLGVPLHVHLLPRTIYHSLRVVFGRYSPKDTITQSFADACSIALTRKLWQYLGWIPRYLELFAEIKKTRPLVTEIHQPVFAFQSAKDELVSMRSCKVLQKNPGIKLTVLKNSGHFYYTPKETEILCNAFTEFIIQ